MNAIKMMVVVGILMSGTMAWAQSDSRPPAPDLDAQCEVDADCPNGFTCIIGETELCTPCASDGDCSPCESAPFAYCEPPPPTQCASDADCAGTEVCVSYDFGSCSTGGSVGCADGEDCAPAEPVEPVCTTETESYCVPQYVAPCSADADCGGGFTCEDIGACSCSGTVDSDGDTGTDGSTGSDDAPSVEPDCDCGPTGDMYCQLIEVECATDAECAGDLLCTDMGGGDIAIGVPCAEGETCDTLPPEPAPSLRCAPDGFDTWGGSGGADRVADATGAEEGVQTGDRVSWGTTSDDKGSDDGCSSTGNSGPAGLLPMFLALGFIGIRRRRS